MTNDEMTYIHHVFTENTGGGSMVDYVCLKNGKVIGISDECLVLFDSYDDACEDDGTKAKGVIQFDKEYVYQGKE
jgi:hypothetical protein